MNLIHRGSLAILLLLLAIPCDATDLAADCSQPALEAHVREQFALYGPQSGRHEYFGFVYLHEGVIGSAVTRSRACAKAGRCVVDSGRAIALVPRAAKVLGEWHTHPHDGSPSLSKDDVRGAYNNHHVTCYRAFYSTPSGEIYQWSAERISVPMAMASRVQIGSYTDQACPVCAGVHSNGSDVRILRMRREHSSAAP
jgi:hypothetical protein